MARRDCMTKQTLVNSDMTVKMGIFNPQKVSHCFFVCGIDLRRTCTISCDVIQAITTVHK